jgi:hypothetical protein
MSNLYILTDNERQAFDYPPVLPVETRAVCFVIDNELEKEIKRLRIKSFVHYRGLLIQRQKNYKWHRVEAFVPFRQHAPYWFVTRTFNHSVC